MTQEVTTDQDYVRGIDQALGEMPNDAADGSPQEPHSSEPSLVRVDPPEENGKATVATNRPALHIDIQVHIDPTSSAELIDNIFASMAKHLYGLGS